MVHKWGREGSRSESHNNIDDINVQLTPRFTHFRLNIIANWAKRLDTLLRLKSTTMRMTCSFTNMHSTQKQKKNYYSYNVFYSTNRLYLKTKNWICNLTRLTTHQPQGGLQPNSKRHAHASLHAHWLNIPPIKRRSERTSKCPNNKSLMCPNEL